MSNQNTSFIINAEEEKELETTSRLNIFNVSWILGRRKGVFSPKVLLAPKHRNYSGNPLKNSFKSQSLLIVKLKLQAIDLVIM